jgi:hypothetical protein
MDVEIVEAQETLPYPPQQDSLGPGGKQLVRDRILR